ncbi:hypothetical protein [Roseicella aquatilis]|uniref:DUF4148 domain-containing protein n=1 Tax=Roseicella aquatilis TaxID=2527868 RepID=A0A4R4DJK4_9PROT|nr:hypothetical protein [Roseicella aquatilis]TCZ61363.1 hypothetical protein EXY23_12535 [Roseicella aquatilis]
MRYSGIAVAVAALVLATNPALAAEKHRGKARHGAQSSAAASQDNMSDQLNAQSLARAQAGQNSPGVGPDTTGNLNRMSEQDAAKGRNMNTAPMPFR